MYDNYPQETAAKSLGGCVEIHRPTLTERLKGERNEVAKRLSELDAAITALESNPQVQTILDLVQNVARY